MSPTQIGPYRLGERLGRQTRHQVFAATHIETGEQVAVKLVNLTSKVDHDFAVKRVQLEARILERLDHPHLVKILDALVVENQLCFIMEKVDAEPLSQRLRRRGKLAWDLAVDHARQLAEALDYLHQEDLLHLKLTPDKVLVSDDGQIKLTDMRINRARKRRWDDARSRVLDTAAYLAPEFLAGEEVTAKCDLYSLGVILFEMITGKLPFEPDTMERLIQRKRHLTPPSVSSLVMECPVWVDKLVASMIAGDPARRPHTMHAALLSLIEAQKMDASKMGVAQRVAKGFNPLSVGRDPGEARRLLGMEEKPEKTPRDWSIPALVAGLALVILLAGLGIGWALLPLSPDKMLERARELVAADDAATLSEAKRTYLLPLLEKVPQGPLNDEARQLLDVAETKLAGRKMRLNYKFDREPNSEGERLCRAAWLREEDEEWLAAWRLYRNAAQAADANSEDRGYHLFAQQEMKRIAEILAKQDDARERIQTETETAAQEFAAQKLDAAQARLQELIAIYGESETLLPDLVRTVEGLAAVNAALEAQQKAKEQEDATTEAELLNTESTENTETSAGEPSPQSP